MAKKNSTSLISEGLWSELRKIKGVISAGPLPSGGAARGSMEMYMRYWDRNGGCLNTPDEQLGLLMESAEFLRQGGELIFW